MTSPIYYAGGEDISFIPINSGIVTSSIGGGGAYGVSIDTTAGHFRSGFARYALNVTWSQNANGCFLTTPSLSKGGGGLTSFWFSARVYASSTSGTTATGTPWTWVFRDASGVNRLRMRNTTTGPLTAGGPFAIEKITAAGGVTQLGSNSTSGFTNAPSPADKLDVYLNYGASGTITVYINGTQVFTYSGDTTTDGNTVIDSIMLGMVSQNNQGQSSNTCAWSEIIVSSSDTRNMSLVTLAAVALGNTHNFTTGVLTDINGNLANYTSPDNSQTTAQIQEYETTPANPVGSFSVVSMVSHMMATIGSSGPAHLYSVKRVGGTDYTSSLLTPSVAWGLVSYNWDQNPNTSAAWQTTDYPNSTTSFNTGYESAT